MKRFRRMSKVLVGGMVISIMVGCGANQSASVTTDRTDYTAAEEYVVDSVSTTESVEMEYNTEEYSTFVEHSFVSAKDEPLSTFSADVDTASYSNVRRMILDGYLPQVDAVKVEEFINYFSYDYEPPTGEEPLGIQTELTECPWNEDSCLLAIGISAEDIEVEDLPPSNLVFLIDTSGSMSSEDKLPLVQEAFSLLVEQLQPGDRISIVTYAGSTEVILEGATYNQKQEIIDGINSLYAAGSTNGGNAISEAYALAEEYFMEGGNNRIILATDGDLNVGVTSESDLKELVEAQRDSGIYLSVLGFGDGNYKDNKLETLSQNGNGNYYYIDSKIEAQKVLVEEMGATLYTVAQDVKIQVEFNPLLVEGYRLIGYENRTLSTSDYVDDTKDAGEIGAGHEVTALYEIVLTDSDQIIDSTQLKYQEQTYVDSEELLTVSVRYKEPGEDASSEITTVVTSEMYRTEMSDNMMVASAVAEFAMLLRESEDKGSASYEAVLERVRNSQLFMEDDYVVELYTLVKKASALN